MPNKDTEVFKKVNVIYNHKTHELYIDDYETDEQLAVFVAGEMYGTEEN